MNVTCSRSLSRLDVFPRVNIHVPFLPFQLLDEQEGVLSS